MKGGVSRFAARNGDTISGQRRKWIDDPWEPLDDYEAPFREPILPPPDFIPNDTGVGVPLPPEEDADKDGGNSIESVLNNSLFSRRPKKIERELEDNEIKTLPPTAKKKIKEAERTEVKENPYINAFVIIMIIFNSITNSSPTAANKQDKKTPRQLNNRQTFSLR